MKICKFLISLCLCLKTIQKNCHLLVINANLQLLLFYAKFFLFANWQKYSNLMPWPNIASEEQPKQHCNASLATLPACTRSFAYTQLHCCCAWFFAFVRCHLTWLDYFFFLSFCYVNDARQLIEKPIKIFILISKGKRIANRAQGKAKKCGQKTNGQTRL